MKRAPRGIVLTLCTAVIFAFHTDVFSQNLGTINLPASIADQNTKIENALPSKPQKIGYCEGPVVDKKGNLFFSEQNAGIIWKVTTSGTVSKWMIFNTSYVNGLDISPDGNMVVCEKTSITERDTNGNLIRVITSASGNNWGQGANDLTFASNGDMFFTAFNQHFWFHSKDNSINRDYNYTSPSNIYFNGIEYLEEKGFIYICQWGQNKVIKCNVGPNGVVDTLNKKTFVNINGPDGITVDANYNVYIASNNAVTGGVHVYDSTGKELGSIVLRQDNNLSGNTSNCVFGGPDNKTLYITGDSGAYKVQLKVPGRVRPSNVHALRMSGNHIIERQKFSSLDIFINGNRYSSSGNNTAVYDIRGRIINSKTDKYTASASALRVIRNKEHSFVK